MLHSQSRSRLVDVIYIVSDSVVAIRYSLLCDYTEFLLLSTLLYSISDVLDLFLGRLSATLYHPNPRFLAISVGSDGYLHSHISY